MTRVIGNVCITIGIILLYDYCIHHNNWWIALIGLATYVFGLIMETISNDKLEKRIEILEEKIKNGN